jgi:hypothetical protein
MLPADPAVILLAQVVVLLLGIAGVLVATAFVFIPGRDVRVFRNDSEEV